MELNRKYNSSFFPYSAEGGSKSALDQWKTPVTIKKDGNCSWMAPGVVKTSCKLNVRYFPFDEQVKVFCSLYTTQSNLDAEVCVIFRSRQLLAISRSYSLFSRNVRSSLVLGRTMVYSWTSSQTIRMGRATPRNSSRVESGTCLSSQLREIKRNMPAVQSFTLM